MCDPSIFQQFFQLVGVVVIGAIVCAGILILGDKIEDKESGQ